MLESSHCPPLAASSSLSPSLTRRGRAGHDAKGRVGDSARRASPRVPAGAAPGPPVERRSS